VGGLPGAARKISALPAAARAGFPTPSIAGLALADLQVAHRVKTPGQGQQERKSTESLAGGAKMAENHGLFPIQLRAALAPQGPIIQE
jgi:hypothetical protein